MNEPIDIVILWVDNQDEDWQQKKEFWQARKGISDNQEERYRDWDNLHYLFRGIEKYASWVNHVFLVTDNQKPAWLNQNYDKVSLVDHKEIIDSEHLPSFNSSGIELNIHKIDKLSENFIYFNDDMFLLKDTNATDFFVNGVPKDTAIIDVLAPDSEPISKLIFNNMAIINKEFDKKNTVRSKPFNWFNFKYGSMMMRTLLLSRWDIFPTFYMTHICMSYNKETFNLVWDKYKEQLINTTSHKFRDSSDYTQWLMRYWQLASNNFVPRTINFGESFSLQKDESIDRCVEHIRNQKTKIVCVNDNELLEDFPTSKKRINAALENLLFKKSKFEK